MAAGRYEEARSLVREMMAEYGESVPPPLQRSFNFQLGMIAMVQDKYSLAHELLSAAISGEGKPAYSKDEIMIVTMASMASRMIGNAEEADERLLTAERKVQRARLNGVDHPGIYYTEAVLLTMRNNPDQAMVKLQQAYDRGFRERWLMQIDGRLDSLRGQPDFIALQNQLDDDINKALTEIRSLSVAAL
jgi:hypothetical protein